MTARPRVGVIVQARMSSSRRPGKVLHPVGGSPVLGHLLARLRRCTGLDTIGIATSDRADDAPIASFAADAGVPCFRGSLENVAGRYLAAAEQAGLDAFVRVTGDSPLLDPALVDRAVALYRAGDADLVTNVATRTFPRGQSVEVVNVATYREHYQSMRDAADLEHVTRALYRRLSQLRVVAFTSGMPWGDIQLSVDTPEDLRALETIVARMTRPPETYGLAEILEIRAALS
ncbi:MAG: NTP transferase domain-containing protein [Gemmatimonadota bacterium]|nr:NTP transferase domain-containing protein [Gemmatimonadota bacterium]